MPSIPPASPCSWCRHCRRAKRQRQDRGPDWYSAMPPTCARNNVIGQRSCVVGGHVEHRQFEDEPYRALVDLTGFNCLVAAGRSAILLAGKVALGVGRAGIGTVQGHWYCRPKEVAGLLTPRAMAIGACPMSPRYELLNRLVLNRARRGRAADPLLCCHRTAPSASDDLR